MKNPRLSRYISGACAISSSSNKWDKGVAPFQSFDLTLNQSIRSWVSPNARRKEQTLSKGKLAFSASSLATWSSKTLYFPSSSNSLNAVYNGWGLIPRFRKSFNHSSRLVHHHL